MSLQDGGARLMTGPSRTRRYLDGIGLGYLQTACVTLVGLWLAPFLIGRLGQEHYGLWLVGMQVLGYLALLDFGIVALLPREVAHATGAARSGDLTAPAAVLRTASTLVVRQLPLVLLAALAVWLVLPQTWADVSGPLGIAFLAFAALFPLRLYPAALQGLQDLRYVGVIHFAAWAAGTVLTVVLVLAGAGLYSLAVGWAAGQGVLAAAARLRLAQRFPELLARTRAAAPGAARSYIGSSFWVSLSQVSQVLLAGSDLLILGWLVGPAALVPYACTTKLALVLANQPNLLVNTALPALSEARGTGDTQRLVTIASAISQIVLASSGFIACVVLIANASFVKWWVGPEQYAGLAVTGGAVAVMMLRHLNVTFTKILFGLGEQRAISLIGLADGAAAVALSWLLVPRMGVVGALAGQAIAVCAISLPLQGFLIGRVLGAPARGYFGHTVLLVARLAVPGILAALAAWTVPATGAGSLFLQLACAAAIYAAVAGPLALRPPLRPWVDRAIAALSARDSAPARAFGRLLQRLPHPGRV